MLANSTCFETELIHLIAEKASKMKKNSWFITLTKKLPTSDANFIRDDDKREWDCVLSVKREMSWGPATVHLHRKLK